MCQQGRSDASRRSSRGSGHPAADRGSECAIFAGESEQFHAGANKQTARRLQRQLYRSQRDASQTVLRYRVIRPHPSHDC
jgi:hypothetical protein